MIVRTRAFVSAGLLITGWIFALPAQAEPTIRLDVRGQKIEGRPIAWTDEGVLLMSRDGQLSEFPPDQAKGFQKVSDRFTPFSAVEMRGRLQAEFGDRFDVTPTGHYLVVHPRGERQEWAERFEHLYRNFIHYFTARGFRPTTPEFPLVAVVFKNQLDFMRYAAAEGVNIGGGTLGYYSPANNRVLLYDVTGGRGGQEWSTNADTIIHEATHQTAFNTGVHSRLAPQPKWLCEGLATMFEARGVWNSTQYRTEGDRINRYRLERFRDYQKTRRRPGSMEELIGSDRLFSSDPDAAYAEAWALSFYLAEREPRRYFELLQKMAARPPLQTYTAARRLADFRSVFGDNISQVEARMLRFIADLR